MSHPPILVGITDPVSSGALLAQEVHKRGGACIEVRSTPAYGEMFVSSFRADDFAHRVLHRGNVAETAAQLSTLGVTHIIAGAESGVQLADQLSAQLGLLGNGVAKSEARRHKYAQMQALQKAGLDTIESGLFSSLPEALVWAQTRYPVFGKPPNSGGSDGSFVAQNPNELAKAWASLWGATNLLGITNEQILLQEYVQQATEWAVNTVSCQGKHVITDIWQYDKRKLNGAPAVYYETNLMPFVGQESLLAYALSVLDVLEISYGPAHLEIFERVGNTDGAQKRYTLVEANIRLPGILPPLATACTQRNQVSLSVDAYVQPTAFFATAAAFRPVLHKQGKWLVLIGHDEGVLAQAPPLQPFERLPSFFSSRLYATRKGDPVQKTIDLSTLLGTVMLCHEDPAVLSQDRDEIRRQEPVFFQVRPA